MTFAPQVETAELSDTDLDGISGGHSVSAGVDAGADAGVAVVLDHGSVGVGVYAEAGPSASPPASAPRRAPRARHAP
ncbi:hypothetical protein SHKM778_07030 [Streptomyces sp. KM77-8]|uniref:Uncharacterized protein n=1 Tax=Streptomyces haneummycinicus TaxID=3074435 RepID=A0AAT9HAD1_9ACTN